MDAVAKKAGVSKATVHRVLRESGPVAPQTRTRVLAAIHELRYRPNDTARSLRQERTATLGVVMATLSNSFHVQVLQGIQAEAFGHGYGVLLGCADFDMPRQRQIISLFQEKGVDGLICDPFNPADAPVYYDKIMEDGTEVVFVNEALPGENVDAVLTDGAFGAYLAGQHLLGLGRERIACLAAVNGQVLTPSSRSRLSGLSQALEAAGLERAALVQVQLQLRADEGQERLAYEAISSGWRRGEHDGLFVVTDRFAYGAIDALTDLGFRVPEDVSVVGFDDLETSAYFRPALTTVRQPARDIGREAVRLMLRRLQPGEDTHPRQRLHLKPTLIVRDSCGARNNRPIAGGISPSALAPGQSFHQ